MSRANAEHYTWGDGCDGWWLVRTDALAVIEERMPPGTSERAHRHARSRQFFFVLAGELTMQVDEGVSVLKVGQGLEIAPGAVHQAVNRSADEVRFIVTSVPPSHGDRQDVEPVV